jgi:hypothetical protein
MARGRLTWLVAAGVIGVLVAATVDAVRSSEPSGSALRRVATTEQSAVRETTTPVGVPRQPLPRCTTRHIGVSIDVLGGTATVVVRHVWGSSCHLTPLPVRLSLTDRVGRRARLAGVDEAHPDVQARVRGDFFPGFEQLIDIPYLTRPQLADCDAAGPFTAFVTVGPHSAQRKLSGSEVGCFRGG